MGHDATRIWAQVSISDCRAVLVADTNSVAALCRHANINRWSYDKPFRFNSYGFWEPGDSVADVRGKRRAALKEADYGLGVKIHNHASIAVQSLKEGLEWEYLAPRGGAFGEPYRLADFDMYYSETAPWFDMAISGPDKGASGDVIRFAMSNLDLNWLWENMSSFSALNKAQTFVGLLIIPKGSGQSMFYRICPMSDFSDNKQLNFTIPSGMPLGEYNAYPCVVQLHTPPMGADAMRTELIPIGAVDSTLDGQWIPLPTNEAVFEVTETAQNDPTSLLSVNVASGTVEWTQDNSGMWIGYVTSGIAISYDPDAAISPLGSCTISYTDNNGIALVTRSFAISKGETVNINMGTVTLQSVTEPKDIGIATLRYEMNVTVGIHTYKRIGYIQIGQ